MSMKTYDVSITLLLVNERDQLYDLDIHRTLEAESLEVAIVRAAWLAAAEQIAASVHNIGYLGARLHPDKPA